VKFSDRQPLLPSLCCALRSELILGNVAGDYISTLSYAQLEKYSQKAQRVSKESA
jgi:hypothetical protein